MVFFPNFRLWIPRTVQRSALCRSRRELSNECLVPQTQAKVCGASFARGHKVVLSGAADSYAYAWLEATGKTYLEVDSHTSWVRAVASDFEGITFASAGADRYIAKLDLTPS